SFPVDAGPGRPASGRSRARPCGWDFLGTETRSNPMWKLRWLLALPLALAMSLTSGAARPATIRDQAGLFSGDAVRKAQAELDRIEREDRLPTTIETVGSLEGQNVGEVLQRHAEQAGAQGLYVLIAKKEKKIDVKASRRYRQAITLDGERAIREA